MEIPPIKDPWTGILGCKIELKVADEDVVTFVNGTGTCVVQDHSYQCSRFLLACPNRCDVGKIAREDMTTHMSQFCPAAVIPCQFREIGCKHVVFFTTRNLVTLKRPAQLQ